MESAAQEKLVLSVARNAGVFQGSVLSTVSGALCSEERYKAVQPLPEQGTILQGTLRISSFPFWLSTGSQGLPPSADVEKGVQRG